MTFNRNYIKKILESTSGYALIEQIVSIVIIGIIATSMVSFLSSTSLTFDQIKTRKQLITDNTVGIEMLTQEFSHMYNLITSDSKIIQFTTSMDTTTVISYKVEEGGSLSRSSGGGSYQTIAQNIDYDNSQFTYFNESGSIGTPVRRIRLYLLSSLKGVSSPITIDIAPYLFR